MKARRSVVAQQLTRPLDVAHACVGGEQETVLGFAPRLLLEALLRRGCLFRRHLGPGGNHLHRRRFGRGLGRQAPDRQPDVIDRRDEIVQASGAQRARPLYCSVDPAAYFPEAEERSPWRPFHVEKGFRKDESVASVFFGGRYMLAGFGPRVTWLDVFRRVFAGCEQHLKRGLEINTVNPALNIDMQRVLDNLSAHKGSKIRQWARTNKVELCFTPTNASWANPIEAQFGPLRTFTMAGSNPANHAALARELQAYLRWRNANARHPDVLAAQRRERARVRSEKGIRWGGRPLAPAA